MIRIAIYFVVRKFYSEYTQHFTVNTHSYRLKIYHLILNRIGTTLKSMARLYIKIITRQISGLTSLPLTLTACNSYHTGFQIL